MMTNPQTLRSNLLQMGKANIQRTAVASLRLEVLYSNITPWGITILGYQLIITKRVETITLSLTKEEYDSLLIAQVPSTNKEHKEQA